MVDGGFAIGVIIFIIFIIIICACGFCVRVSNVRDNTNGQPPSHTCNTTNTLTLTPQPQQITGGHVGVGYANYRGEVILPVYTIEDYNSPPPSYSEAMKMKNTSAHLT